MASKIPVAPLGAPSQTADDFRIYTAQPDVRFLSRAVQPPSYVYVDPNDDLTVACATSQTNETVTVSYRLLRADGELVLGQFTLSPPNTRAVATHTESLAEGFLLSVSCKAAVATTRGQTFVRVFLSDPALGAGQPSYMLMADYITTQLAPAHPNGRVLAPSEGPGWTHQFVATPAGAGLQWTFAVPTNARLQLRTIFAILSTDATVGNRTVRLDARIAGGTAFAATATAVQAPSLTVSYTYSPLATLVPLLPALGYVPLPPGITQLGGDIIEDVTALVGAADRWTAVGIFVEEWLDNV